MPQTVNFPEILESLCKLQSSHWETVPWGINTHFLGLALLPLADDHTIINHLALLAYLEIFTELLFEKKMLCPTLRELESWLPPAQSLHSTLWYFASFYVLDEDSNSDLATTKHSTFSIIISKNVAPCAYPFLFYTHLPCPGDLIFSFIALYFV